MTMMPGDAADARGERVCSSCCCLLLPAAYAAAAPIALSFLLVLFSAAAPTRKQRRAPSSARRTNVASVGVVCAALPPPLAPLWPKEELVVLFIVERGAAGSLRSVAQRARPRARVRAQNASRDDAASSVPLPPRAILKRRYGRPLAVSY